MKSNKSLPAVTSKQQPNTSTQTTCPPHPDPDCRQHDEKELDHPEASQRSPRYPEQTQESPEEKRQDAQNQPHSEEGTLNTVKRITERLEQHNRSPQEQVELVRKHYSWADALKLAFVIWWTVFRKIYVTLSLNIIFMSFYYLPGIILSRQLLDHIYSILYDKVLKSMWVVFYWTSMGIMVAVIFSLRALDAPTSLSFAIVLSKDLLFLLLPQISRLSYSPNISSALDLLFFTFLTYLITKSAKPENMTPEAEIDYRLTKDGTPWCIFKGLVCVFLFINFVIFNIFPIYLASSFYVRLGFRFVVFPLCFSVCRWYQARVIFHLSKDEMDRRLVGNKVVNYYLQFIGRIFISNISSNSAFSVEFIITNFASAAMEFTYVFLFTKKTKFFYQLNKNVGAIYNQMQSMCSKKKIFSFNSIQGHTDGNEEPQVDDGNQDMVCEEQYVKDAISFRAKHLYDDIGSEICALFVAPLLMYFLYPLIPNTTDFQTIQSFNECLMQIFIQLIFEMGGDVLSLGYEIRHGLVNPDSLQNWRRVNPLLFFAWSWYCLMAMHSRILLLG